MKNKHDFFGFLERPLMKELLSLEKGIKEFKYRLSDLIAKMDAELNSICRRLEKLEKREEGDKYSVKLPLRKYTVDLFDKKGKEKQEEGSDG